MHKLSIRAAGVGGVGGGVVVITPQSNVSISSIVVTLVKSLRVIILTNESFPAIPLSAAESSFVAA